MDIVEGEEQRFEHVRQRQEALIAIKTAWYKLIERINIAADEGYDVLRPDVLHDWLWTVAENQVAAGRDRPFLDQAQMFVRDYTSAYDDIQQRFPRGLASA